LAATTGFTGAPGKARAAAVESGEALFGSRRLRGTLPRVDLSPPGGNHTLTELSNDVPDRWGSKNG